MTLNRIDREFAQLLENDAQTRVELARVTRRISDLGYYALAVITYAPDAPEAKKSCQPSSKPPSSRAVRNLANGQEIQPAPQGRV